ncbi:hypothetical protein INR49_012680 [Caranx melampygus]|nr:hypothetical protein INR49_012680 [Caranx melampygus]
MTWYLNNRVRNLLEWLWRLTRGFFMCVFTRVRHTIARLVRSAIGWREEPSGQTEPEVEDQTQPQTSDPKNRVEDPQGPRETSSDPQVEEAEEAEEGEGGFDSGKYRVETSDELYCGYDSTWETEEDQDRSRRRCRRPGASRHQYKFSRFENAARDMQNYRHNYPLQIRQRSWIQGSGEMSNLNFYLGQRPSVPDDLYIHDFHNEWKGNYSQLESVHTFIQWLFPLQEPGMNYEASTLTKEEIEEFCKSSIAKENLLKSYELMLDFYGIKLYDKETGAVKKASNWRQRFSNLNSRTHNNLRITRILKCLGTLGYPHYQAPLVHFFLEETLVHGELPNVKESVLNYFLFAVLDKNQRRELIKYAYLNYEPKDEFVWCPRKIQMLWSQVSGTEIEGEVKGRRESYEYNSGWDLYQRQQEDEDEPMDLTN